MSTEIKAMSDKSLKRQEKAASRRLAEIAVAGDPGRGLSRAEGQPLRDERIRSAQTAKAQALAVRAELAQRETEKQTVWGRIWATEAANKRRRDNTPTGFEREREAFHAELKREQDKRNAAEHERRRAAGLVWEPVGPAGGIEVAAVFSSATLWQATANEIRDGAHHEPSLHARDIAHLWWSLNLIAASGGSATFAAGPGRCPPHWPSYDREAVDGITYRENCLAQLERLGYLAIERGAGTLTISHGSRTVALAATFRKHWKGKAA